MTQDDTQDRARELAARCAHIEEAIEQLRAGGFAKIASIRAIHSRFDISLGDAKVAVDASPTWADRREADGRFQDEVVAALEAMGRDARAAEHRRDGLAGQRGDGRWSIGPLWPGLWLLAGINAAVAALPLACAALDPSRHVVADEMVVVASLLSWFAILLGIVVMVVDSLSLLRRPLRLAMILLLMLAPTFLLGLAMELITLLFGVQWQPLHVR